MTFDVFAEVPVNAHTGRIYEEGFQSWNPVSHYPISSRSYRPVGSMAYRPGHPAPDHGFQGEGLLVVDPGDDGPVHLFATTDGLSSLASIRTELVGDKLIVRANGPIEERRGTSTAAALADWAKSYGARAQVGPIRPAPTVWCSFYHYFSDVAERDIDENMAAIDKHELPVDVIQLDEGWQPEFGDWLTTNDRFVSLAGLAGRIRDGGRRAGIWLAPFLVREGSGTLRRHPHWLIRDEAGEPVDAGTWDRPMYALDPGHPEVRAYLSEVLGSLRDAGYDYFKFDFLHVAALDGTRSDGSAPIASYRAGLAFLREQIGPDAYLLACGAPLLPSAGLVDAMRVSPDIAVHYEPIDGDPTSPSQRAAALSTTARAWQHGRLWVNDPDCLIVRPGVERRRDWAYVIENYGGLRASSDRIEALDAWGLETTRRLLSEVPPATPFALD